MPLDQTPGGIRQQPSAAGPVPVSWWKRWRQRRRELRAQWYQPYPEVEPDWDNIP